MLFFTSYSLEGVLPEKIRNRHNKLGFPGPEDKLFEKPNPAIQNQLKELVEKFPQIFSSSLLTEYEQAISTKPCKRSMIFRAL